MTQPRHDDTKVVQALDGMMGGIAFLVSYDLKLFELLGRGSQSASQLAAALGIGERPAEALLTVAAAQGFVHCSNAMYKLTPTAEEYLLPESPTYYGPMIDLRMAAMPVYTFETLKKSVLNDNPQAYGGRDVFAGNAADSTRAQVFTRAMHSRSMAAALAWPKLLDLSCHRRLLDIGGGSGAHSIGAALQWPQLAATVLDIAPVCAIAAQYVSAERLSERIHTLPSDMFDDPFPSADMHFYGNVYHDWPAEKCRFLTGKSYGALPSGGRLVIHEMLYDNDKNGQRFIWDVSAVDESIHQILVSRAAKFHDDIVDCGRKPGIANEREPKRVALLVTVIVAECHDPVERKASTIAAIGSTGTASFSGVFSSAGTGLGACARIRAVKTVAQAIVRRGLLIASPDSQ